MFGSHFLIWCGIIFSVVSNAVIGWKWRQLKLGQDQFSREREQFLLRLTAMERWSGAMAPFVDSLNRRLVSLETENTEITPKKRDEDEDPFSGSRAWVSQAAAIERAAGVR